ncbi:hypothetical protein [Cupriavidus sp. CuC1]|uniref:hypothetical protein n=1 Tax=Cupriavidus sp. CuC1 TaxID=3373131 RepID=UPI0037D754FA
MEDEFLQAEPITADASGWRIEASYDAFNKTLDIFNLRDHKDTAERTGDYSGGRLAIGYKISPAWSVQATYWRRNLKFQKDTDNINSWQLAVHYGILVAPEGERKLTLKLSAWGDYASSLASSTTTRINGTSFSNVSIAHANDVQAQADLIYSGRLWEHNLLSGFITGGFSRVTTGDFQGTYQQGSCRFNVQAESNNMATATLVNPCQIGRATVRNLQLSANASQYGLDVDHDFHYTAPFLALGGSWRWEYKHFGVMAGYQFQYLFRNGIDDRLASHGVPQVRFNQTVGLELSYAPVKHCEVFLRAQGFQNSFVGYVPLLYNAATTSRLDKFYGLASVGVRVFGF